MVIVSGAIFFAIVFAGGAAIAAVIFGGSKLLGLLSIVPEWEVLTFKQAMSFLDVIMPALFFAGVIVLIFDKLGIINLQALKSVEKAK